eukprot:CAMPEP_0172663238 /NCGR_PEP_ID=MMETSP1074-20121228/5795_1 /TAXON_ID=2916 /ORGANISM="Ceratium fusus, Strain PA161109" /LENGTH=527 /DNA_ID=CAMNT_0013479203 /DNA_START=54 /DNA_END=1637 /DNA_ORIENTATION=-
MATCLSTVGALDAAAIAQAAANAAECKKSTGSNAASAQEPADSQLPWGPETSFEPTLELASVAIEQQCAQNAHDSCNLERTDRVQHMLATQESGRDASNCARRPDGEAMILAILETEGVPEDSLAPLRSHGLAAATDIPRVRELRARSHEDLASLAAAMGLRRNAQTQVWTPAQLSEAEREDAVSLILHAEGLSAESAPPVEDLEGRTKAKLELLAVAMGIKRVRVGWATCCPPRGTKQDIVSALLKAWQLAQMSKAELQALAFEKNIKSEELDWTACCPPAGDKEDIIRAIIRFEALGERKAARGAMLREKTYPELEERAQQLGIKAEGLGWAKSCPPSGCKDDIASAIVRMEDLRRKPKPELKSLAAKLRLDGYKASSRSRSRSRSQARGVGQRSRSPHLNKNALAMTIFRAEAAQLEAEHRKAARIAELEVVDQRELDVLVGALVIEPLLKALGVSERRNRAIHAIARAEELLSLPRPALEAVAIQQGIKGSGVGWASCCPPEGSKSDVVHAILRCELRNPSKC